MTIGRRDERDTADRAYALWEARGRPIGSPQQDWFEAETQLQAELAGASQPKATLDPLAQKTADELLDGTVSRDGTNHPEDRAAGTPSYVLPEAGSRSKRQRRSSSAARSAH